MSKLQVLKHVAMISFLTLMPVFAFAGGAGPGGGGAFICPNSANSELLDLFEAQIPGIVTPKGLHIPVSNAPIKAQIQAAFNKLNPGSPLYQRVLEVYKEVRSAKNNAVPKGVSIRWPRDADNEVTKTGCDPRGIVLYDDHDNSILLDRRDLNSMPREQQAALWVHETIYKFLRETQHDPNSIRARKIVGNLFSDESRSALDKALASIADLYPYATNSLAGPSQGGLNNWVYNLTYFGSYPGQNITLYEAIRRNDKMSAPNCVMPPLASNVTNYYQYRLGMVPIDGLDETVKLNLQLPNSKTGYTVGTSIVDIDNYPPPTDPPGAKYCVLTSYLSDGKGHRVALENFGSGNNESLCGFSQETSLDGHGCNEEPIGMNGGVARIPVIWFFKKRSNVVFRNAIYFTSFLQGNGSQVANTSGLVVRCSRSKYNDSTCERAAMSSDE